MNRNLKFPPKALCPPMAGDPPLAEKIKNHLKLLLCIALLCFCWQTVIAAETANHIYSIRLDEATIKRGYEIKGFDDKFQVAVFPFVLKAPTKIELKNRTEIAMVENADKLAVAGNGDNEYVINRDATCLPACADRQTGNISTTTTNVIPETDAINQPAPVCADRQAGCASTINVDIIASSTNEAGIESGSSSSRLLIGENPDGWKINSDIYEFDVRDKDAFDGRKPFVVTMKYGFDFDNNEDSADTGITPCISPADGCINGKQILNRQKIFYFDNGKNKWIPLPSTIMYNEKSVRAIIQLPYAKLAVFENDNILSVGSASWYKYKSCNCAASPDYAKGTKLKVTNLYNNKSVIVAVNDYGPERDVFPERVIDLDVEAFAKIAKKGAGVIDVKVEPLDEICSYVFEKAKHPENPAPEISAPFAVLIDEPTGEALYQKNADKKVPIASITKLMTASVFMDVARNSSESPLGDSDGTKNMDVPLVKGGKDDDRRDAINLPAQAGRVSTTSAVWDKIITYNKADDMDGARLYVNDGETMTIKDVFYSMIVGSANNAAKTLVRNSGIAYSDFIAEMNKKAKEWHLENTIFKEPTGLDSRNVSAAIDVANMARYVFKNFEMLKASTMSQYSFKTINTGKAHTIKTTNTLLYDKDLYITGAKTGFLNEAGNCLVLKAKNRNDGREVIAVVLGEDSSEARFADVKKLAQWGLGD